MKSPERKLLFASGLLVAATSLNACGKPVDNTPLPSSISTSAGLPANIEDSYRLVPVPCKTELPWEGVSYGQKTTADSVVVFASVKTPESKTSSGTGPECWEITQTGLNN